MDTFYIRHTQTMDVERPTLDYLWDNQKIAVHFPQRANPSGPDDSDNPSLNPEDYVRTGKSAMKIFLSMKRDGGYVLAEFCHHPGCLIGVVVPGTEIELYRGKWGNRSGLQGREAVLKTLQLSRCEIVPEARAVKLLAGRPRQGTVMRWPSARELIKNRIEGHVAPQTVRDLIPTLQEVMCSEFLRLPTEMTGLPQLSSLILPVGRTLRHLDIYGLSTQGFLIAAQVTLQPSTNCAWKIDPLKTFDEPGIHKIFFCDDATRSNRDGIEFYPLSEVYSKFTSIPAGQRWLGEVAR